ncbi:MAG: hypothetical protein NT170_03625 [Candidatus Moranbacteria bacterium]|nr:hypothetical protein [Candidatus Moranbacteria bacterium]
MVSQQLLKELQEIIKEEYGQDLEMEKISQIGNGLVGYFDLLAKMHHKNNQNNEDEYEIQTAEIQG